MSRVFGNFMYLVLAKNADIFNEALGLSWKRSKLVFTPEEINQLKQWFVKHYSEILSARQFNLFWQKNSLALEKDQHFSPQELLRALDELHYDRTRLVEVPGDYAHRGEIVDVYPINYNKPLRIEFLGNTIERIYFLQQKEIDRLKSEAKLHISQGAVNNLSSGDYVVHIDHGIGKFKGILLRRHKKYYEIEYAAHDILLVPEGLEGKLSPYLGFVEPKLTRLGGSVWHKTKKKVKENALKLAKELLRLYAQREIITRPPYLSFEEEKTLDVSFEYDLTPDQRKTWQEINKDLSLDRPMDRLICGDVGFGKTEIALRAAFKVAMNGKQAVVLSPTTILADQHYHTFVKRLQKFPIHIAMLSRLTSPRLTKKILKDLKAGTIKILIGTHRLLSQDIAFQDLGLLIIDEEQRFGVKQKEKLKQLRANIDLLSLSATPIPRTLHMALSKLKDVSLIATPPSYKKPIKTFVKVYNKALIRKIILQETKRKGQAYYLHNRVGTLSHVKEKLKKIIPEARFACLHGRMGEQSILRTIHNFRKGNFDVLIATTIIENGLDLKNVNTLIVEDATRLGLAQAHQIRGRVGRGEKQSYAYFLYPAHHLNNIAKERLGALKKFSYLGAGYQLALRDLEIRGAGNILGREQSGAINKVGLNLYYQILSQAIEQIKAERKSPTI